MFFCPYPIDEAPSQRFRFEQYLSILKIRDYKVTTLPFFNKWAWQHLYTKNNKLLLLLSTLGQFFKRILESLLVLRANYVFIHREILPIGPPVLEWFIAKVLRKKIIYDFDDAIWLTDKKNEGALTRIMRWRGKVAIICTWSYKVSCGNEYLASYAKQFNKNVILNPTTIDTENLHYFSPEKKEISSRSHGNVVNIESVNNITIGWTGSHSTLKYLEELSEVLIILENKYPQLSFVVIADVAPGLSLQRLSFIKWSKESEAKDLSTIDIGIMPLTDDEWTKGKCGFKALQYMAMQIPAVVSPVAINKVIVTDGENGFWCKRTEEWIERLSQLIEDSTLRKQMGAAGRLFVEQKFSVKSNTENFISLFS